MIVIPKLVEVQGRLKVRVTIRESPDGPVREVDLIDPFNAVQRRKAVERMAERVGKGATAEDIEKEVLQCLEVAKPQADGDEADAAAEGEVAGRITVVRPELVVTPDVVAVSVPEVM